MGIESELRFTVTATDRGSMERRLNEAEGVAKIKALEQGRRQGILVTRHGSNSFSVALSEAVPFGQTRELLDW